MSNSVCEDLNNFNIQENEMNEIFNKYITFNDHKLNKDKLIKNKQINEEETFKNNDINIINNTGYKKYYKNLTFFVSIYFVIFYLSKRILNFFSIQFLFEVLYKPDL